MINFRVIPSMLLIEDSVVKGKNFQNHNYVGDPINILKISLINLSAYNDGRPISLLTAEVIFFFFKLGSLTDIFRFTKIFFNSTH